MHSSGLPAKKPGAGGPLGVSESSAEDLARALAERVPLLMVSTLYKPVPGRPVLNVLRPFELIVYLAPGTPKDKPTVSLLKFKRTPGSNFIDFLKRRLMSRE